MYTHADAEIKTTPIINANLDFLWLELTNQCNLECIHCYADSSPYQAKHGLLSIDDYKNLLHDANTQGCRSVQFIGGEPTLNPALPVLIDYANELGYELIEVYTNLVTIPESLLTCFKKNKVDIATSVYSKNYDVHDTITTRKGSWEKTVANIARIMDSGLSLRASVVEMNENKLEIATTVEWLHSMGISNVGTDKARHFGRADDNQSCDMGELCGECSKGTLCVDPDGVVAPCVMSKAWPVGSLTQEKLSDILGSNKLIEMRQSIYDQTIAIRELPTGGCQPDNRNPCSPDKGSCIPCSPNGFCGPNTCQPRPRYS